MAAGERARRRAERDRAAAEAAAARQAAADRQARREARLATLTRWVPRPAPGQSGALAARHRQRTGLVVGAVVAVGTLVWLGTDAWAARVLFLLLALLVAPIVVNLLTRK